MPLGKSSDFSYHDLIQAMDSGDSIAERDDGSHLVHGDSRFVVLDLFVDYLGNFVKFDLCHESLVLLTPLEVILAPSIMSVDVIHELLSVPELF